MTTETVSTSLYEACGKLFDDYPPAVRDVNHSGTVCSMMLMLRDGGGARFYNLIRRTGDGLPYYVLHLRHADISAKIEQAAGTDQSADTVRAVTGSVPLPRDGSMFGWLVRDHVAALVLSYTDYSPETPEPGWSVLPLGGSPEGDWPPFTGEKWFGPWFWEHVRAGQLASLAPLVAGTSGAVLWADTADALGSNCCAVTRDLTAPEGFTLQRGLYVYYEALRSGAPVPSLEDLLAVASMTDLGDRF
jgi:hypothetical protein